MKKLTLVNNKGKALGMGYMGGSAEDMECLAELKKQIRASGIRATLHSEDVADIDMTELGEAMEEYQSNVDMMEMMATALGVPTLAEENEEEEVDYDVADILGRLMAR